MLAITLRQCVYRVDQDSYEEFQKTTQGPIVIKKSSYAVCRLKMKPNLKELKVNVTISKPNTHHSTVTNSPKKFNE